MCKYSDNSGYKCPHENLKDSEYCIFHLQDDNKDIDEFNKGIKEILETEEDLINFNGFYFPPDTTDFKNVTFKGYTDFKDAEFGGYADFSNTKFKGTADFRNAKFKGEATFFSAVISGYAIFIDVIFSKEVNFTNVTFNEKFEGHAYFFNAEFEGKAYFNDVTFERNAYFNDVTFEGKTYFRRATFKGDANFDNAELIGKILFIPIKSETIIFKKTYFSDNVRIKADLSKCSFANSNIERVDMTDSSWIRDDMFRWEDIPGNDNVRLIEFLKQNFGVDWVKTENIKKIDNGMTIKVSTQKNNFTLKLNNEQTEVNVTIDDGRTNKFGVKIENSKLNICYKPKPKNFYSVLIEWLKKTVLKPETPMKIWEERHGNLKSNWKELEGIYRRLEQSYQKFGDNSTAGIFYYRKKECIRKQSRGLKAFIWNNSIWILCGYGEKPHRLILASGLIIFSASVLFFYHGIELIGSEVLDVTPRVIDYNLSRNFQWAIINFDKVIIDWLVCLYTSVITFTTLGYGDVHPIGSSRIVASVEAGFGIIITALFIFVFTRKMLQ